MDVLSCKICSVPYDEEEHSPRNPPCGHEICSTCLKAIINEGIFECPKCREKNKANVPEDFRLSFGLIDVIRVFKAQNISLPKENGARPSGAANEEDCKVHKKLIEYKCLKCVRWLCGECLQFHTALTGCSTISSSDAVKSLKEKHTKNTEMLLTVFKDDVNYLISKIKEHSDSRHSHLEKAEKHTQEINKIQSMLHQGNSHQEDVVKSKDLLHATNSRYDVMDKIEVLDHMKQSLTSWSIKTLGTDTPLGLLKALKENKNVYVEMIFNDQQLYSKLSQHDEGLHLHRFQKHTVADGTICMHFDRLTKMITSSACLVFLELKLGSTVKGRLLIRLDKNLPNILENMVAIVTGQRGQSLASIKLNDHSTFLFYGPLPFSEIKVTPDINGNNKAKRGDVTGHYLSGYLYYIYFGLAPYNFGSGYKIIGSIISGLDILDECHNNNSAGVIISDCGLVIEM